MGFPIADVDLGIHKEIKTKSKEVAVKDIVKYYLQCCNINFYRWLQGSKDGTCWVSLYSKGWGNMLGNNDFSFISVHNRAGCNFVGLEMGRGK